MVSKLAKDDALSTAEERHASKPFGHPAQAASVLANHEVSMRTVSLVVSTVVGLVICSAAQLRCNFRDLQFPNGVTLGVEGISNRGEAVGNYFPANGAGERGFYFFQGKFVSISHPHSFATTATGVSDRGVIVGYFQDGATVRGFRYENGKFMTESEAKAAGYKESKKD